MRIACLGWGSLIWNPDGLPIRSRWFADGPLLPIEFARFSKRDRVTLVIVEGKADIRSLWTLMTTEHLEDAVDQLARREDVKKNICRDIGRWKLGDPCEGPISHAISSWAVQKQLDAVVWTALAHKIKSEKDRVPTLEQVIARLQKSEKEGNKEPREYFEKTPRQIDTDYRRAINDRFGWKCRSEL